MTKVAIIIYSMYGHIAKLAEAEKAGIEKAGGQADIYQVPETLSDDILGKMHAPPKAPYPVASNDTLTTYDSFLFGIPTRYGNMPAQMKAFFDATGGLWAQGALQGKFFGVFVSTGTGGGNESTVMNSLSVFVHHGMIFVPLGYAKVFAQMTSFDHGVKGGSAWGAGTIAGADGSRSPLDIELEMASIQGGSFYEVVSKYFG
ncbi:flavodoxin-like fold protein [Hanseniaspora vineae]